MRSKVLTPVVARSGDSLTQPFPLRTETGSLADPTITQESRAYMTAARARAAAFVASLALGVAACSASSGTSAESSTPAPSSTPSSTSATRSADPSEAAEDQAIALIPTYLQVIDDLYLDPSRSLDDVYTVAVAPEATSEAGAIATFRAQGYQQVGRSQLVTTSVSSVDLTSDPTASPSPVLPTVVVKACVDVSQVQATDATGTSVVSADRPAYLVAQLTVINIGYPDAASWRVSAAPNTQAQSCDG
jgi:hypothetical protein